MRTSYKDFAWHLKQRSEKSILCVSKQHAYQNIFQQLMLVSVFERAQPGWREAKGEALTTFFSLSSTFGVISRGGKTVLVVNWKNQSKSLRFSLLFFPLYWRFHPYLWEALPWRGLRTMLSHVSHFLQVLFQDKGKLLESLSSFPF